MRSLRSARDRLRLPLFHARAGRARRTGWWDARLAHAGVKVAVQRVCEVAAFKSFSMRVYDVRRLQSTRDRLRLPLISIVFDTHKTAEVGFLFTCQAESLGCRAPRVHRQQDSAMSFLK